jgi:hypothetical protein
MQDCGFVLKLVTLVFFSGRTPMYFSSKHGNVEVCKLLVEYEKAEADVGTETPP